MPANHCTPHTEEAKEKMRAARLGKPALWKRRETKQIGDETHYRCGRCGGFFPKSAFYANKRTLLGIKSECKKCHISTSIKSRNVENARQLNSEHMARARKANPEKFKVRERAAGAVSRQRFPEKVAARNALNLAVKRGDIEKPLICEICAQKRRLAGHHEDYSKPLSVQWLCYSCHAAEHRAASEVTS